MILAGKGKGAGAEGRHQRLEVRLVGHLDEEPDEGDIVLHDEKRPVARLDRLAIVPRLVQHPWRLVRVARRSHRGPVRRLHEHGRLSGRALRGVRLR